MRWRVSICSMRSPPSHGSTRGRPGGRLTSVPAAASRASSSRSPARTSRGRWSTRSARRRMRCVPSWPSSGSTRRPSSRRARRISGTIAGTARRYDLVAARAVAALPVLVEYALPLARVERPPARLEGPDQRGRARRRAPRGRAPRRRRAIGPSVGRGGAGRPPLRDRSEGASYPGSLPPAFRASPRGARWPDPDRRYTRISHAHRRPVGHPREPACPGGRDRRHAGRRRDLGAGGHGRLRTAAERGDRDASAGGCAERARQSRRRRDRRRERPRTSTRTREPRSTGLRRSSTRTRGPIWPRCPRFVATEG